MKNLLNYNHLKARKFFLKEESYFRFELPPYFVFQNLMNKISSAVIGKSLTDLIRIHPKKIHPTSCENVNYMFLNNKDGKFSWRPIQLIHPALYASLVNHITDKVNWEFIKKRFAEFSDNPNINCLGIPIESSTKNSDKAATVNNWWKNVEQKSIELALEYEFVIHTDIVDCYGSIYTHSVAWALHGKDQAKKNKSNNSLIGNIIDKYLQSMSNGQTNGIPQGSVLMDFIAEMVLGYIDLQLSKSIKRDGPKDYKILRYRDDYRIFTNNPQDGELILKLLTEILIDFSMRLNAQKTFTSNNVIVDSIKADKFFVTKNNLKGIKTKNLQDSLLFILSFSHEFPNSGMVVTLLNDYFKEIKDNKKSIQNLRVLISILVEITYRNPRAYPISSAILSKLLSLIGSKIERKKILELITKRFDKIPNTGYLQIWLQRITLKIDTKIIYGEKLCKKVIVPNIKIWNSEWLIEDLKKIIEVENIIDKKILKEIKPVIETKEVSLFIIES